MKATEKPAQSFLPSLLLPPLPSPILLALRVTYSSGVLKSAVSTDRGQKLIMKATEKQGHRADSKASVKQIQEFIKYHNLDLSLVKVPRARVFFSGTFQFF
jgi:hypothetical protein